MRMNGRNTQLMLLAAFVVTLGIASRVFHSGFRLIDNYLGDALYAALFYLLLCLIWKKGAPGVKALLSAAGVIGIEVFQLTNIPLSLHASSNLLFKALAIVLGTTFAWPDIAAYLAGIGTVYLLDRFYFIELYGVAHKK